MYWGSHYVGLLDNPREFTQTFFRKEENLWFETFNLLKNTPKADLTHQSYCISKSVHGSTQKRSKARWHPRVLRNGSSKQPGSYSL